MPNPFLGVRIPPELEQAIFERMQHTGFGHAMFGEGDVAIPMATGYVHYIQPSIRSSFKLGGSLALQGAVVRDEAVGVVGRPGAEFSTWPARVHVSFQPSGLQRQYDYRMAFIPQLTAAQFAIAASMSIESDVTPGMLSTTAIDAEVTFTNGRTLSITETLPSEGGFGLTMALAPPVSAIVDNGFEPLEVAETTINVDVREGVDSATISNITLHQATVEPGRTVTVNVALQPFRSAPIQKRLKIRIPETVPDGKYPLLVSGARGYYQQRVQTRPHLQRVNDLDDLFEAVREVMSVKSTALYATLRVDSRKSLAVGRDELPHLPTSRAALLAEAASTQATPYIQTIEVIEPMPYVIEGQATFQLEVKRKDVPDD